MLLAGSDCCRILDEMVKDDDVIGEVEEGEISDATSVEEISEEDFKKQDNKKSKSKSNSNSNSLEMKETVSADGGVVGGKGGNDTNSRVWTMRELMDNYPAYRGYASTRMQSHAWAQAVMNKPLKEVLGKDVDSSKCNEDDHIMIEDSGEDKEEGELEEGEIDLESEPIDKASADIQSEAETGSTLGDLLIADNVEGETKEKDLENKVKSIRGVLESTSEVEAHKSFEGVSSRLMSAMESLKELVLENDIIPKKDILIQLSFAALQTINSVFRSMNHIAKERNKETVSRLLSIIENHFSPFLSSNQMKEIETMLQSLYMNKLPAVGDYLVKNMNLPSEASKREVSSLRNRVPLLPLLDLHKDHDLDSLPSPTREMTPSLPVNRTYGVEHALSRPEFATVQDREEAKIHPYENDALKAVSTYQQKFGPTSFSGADNLPSPTPSEESNDANGDIGDEISSSSLVINSKPLNMVIGKASVSPSNLNSTNLAGFNAACNVVPRIPVSAQANPQSSVSTYTMKSSAKSRDPRLQFVNSESTITDANPNLLNNIHNHQVESSGGFMNSIRQKRTDETYTSASTFKRQKIGLEHHEAIRDGHKALGSGGWLEDVELADSSSQLIQKAENDIRKIENGTTYLTNANVAPVANVTIGEQAQAPMTVSTTVSLPNLLKDVVVNPTMLIDLLKMGQKQKATGSTRQKPTDPRKAAQLPGSNSISGAASSTSMRDEPTKIRMKPRDPRRVLYGNTLQKTGSVVEEQVKANERVVLGTENIKNKTEGHAEIKTLPSQLVPQQDVVTGKSPDIAPQFTKSLQNIASLVAVSQLSNPPIVPENSVPPTVQLKAERDVKPLTSASGHQNVAGSEPGTSAPVPANPQGGWRDIEHLFEGYDDKQKAAIQRERARRLEEQKKMFAARKLCLVLDLDHTLLNSAKFVEVDPVHDEILRRKEEQDREKKYRHLFWFPHMGMWTKLRPGIWNFLEKASKLYELHLYTMGNKLYATEMAKVLDPKGTLFNGRVISRGDDGDISDGDERVPKTKDLEGVLGMESGVVIIDDSVRVWPHNKMNLIVVERYTYFPCSRRQFGLPGPSLLEIDHDERPDAGTLASSLAVIERIHQNFFSHASLDEADVRNILASEQRKILGGCRIVFSRVFPVGLSNPHHHPLWQTAEQFGAVCTNQVDEKVTHVVANSLGTDKVNWALTKGRFVVYPGWVEASALLYRRANENDFAIKP